LGSSCNPIHIRRDDERTLVIRPEGGFLAAPGSQRPGREVERILFDQHCGFQAVDRLYRDSSPMTKGGRIELLGIAVEITEVTPDGRPAEAVFHFATKLENRFFQWLRWEDGVFVPFAVPAVGERVTLPAARVPFE
ncbi:MAG: hypothetical protein KJ645_02665, partial [Planctomycetes bacterium]|nr:hypothetical protein [Planctomycetota bacterium]